MRKFYLMAFPLIMAVFLVCGCTANQDADAMCEFNCDNVINLKLGTANSSDAVAYAPIETNTFIQNLIIDYDSTIINYEVTTGKIYALSAGTTRIKCTLNGKTKYVQVNVVRSVYCTSLQCGNLVMELGKTADLLSANRRAIVANDDYNMGYTFTSLDKNKGILE